MKIEKSYNVQIWVGLREGYTDFIHDMDSVRAVIDNYIEANSTCVTITPTEFRYYKGFEPGVIIGLIQYPRFPKKESQILEQAKDIAILLKETFKQNRISITTPKYTYMIEDEDEN